MGKHSNQEMDTTPQKPQALEVGSAERTQEQ